MAVLPTTDSEVARNAVDVLFRSAPCALMHGYDVLAKGPVTSDVDIVSGVSARALIAGSIAGLAKIGLAPVVIWKYDLGGTAGVFLASPNAEAGVHIDVFHDPRGRGRYGICSGAVLSGAVQCGPWRCLSPLDQSLYRLAKADAKGDPDRLKRTIQGLSDSQDAAVSRAAQVFASWQRGRVMGLIEAGERAEARFRARSSWWRHLPRGAMRLLDPVGFWAHVSHGREIADAVADRFSRFLVDALSAPVAGRERRMLQTIEATRLRPRLFVSHGSLPRFPTPDLVVTAENVDEACAEIVTAMASRNHR